MKKTLNICFGLLILFTIATALISNSAIAAKFGICLIMGIAVLKFLLVAFEFMDLKKSNIFWKISLCFVLGLIALPIILICW